MIVRIVIASVLLIHLTHAEQAQRVGLPLELHDIYIEGKEIQVKPRHDKRSPLVVRITNKKPAQNGFRYDFEIQGLEAGTYNLADYLETPKGAPATQIPIKITTNLPQGLISPNPIVAGNLPKLGGYKKTMSILITCWLLGLVGILYWKKKKPETLEAYTTTAPTLIERLRPLVSGAATHSLHAEDRAKLERLIIGHWREQLPEIAALQPAEAMMKLRNDSQASPLILALERWLHARDSTTHPTEIETLLAPYK